MRRLFVFLISAAMLFGLSACTGDTQSDDTDAETDAVASTSAATSADAAEPTEHPRVRITMANGNSFVIELYPEYAPKTVKNFLSLVEDGFYDGLTFHRVVEHFAQGGDPEGTGMGRSESTIVGEFALNGHPENTLSHQRGVVSMARTNNNYNSAYSQFFICYGDCSFLDGQYAGFGKVIEGMKTVDDFLKVEREFGTDGEISKPIEKIVMQKAEVLGD